MQYASPKNLFLVGYASRLGTFLLALPLTLVDGSQPLIGNGWQSG